jgi:hypothetical protein
MRRREELGGVKVGNEAVDLSGELRRLARQRVGGAEDLS